MVTEMADELRRRINLEDNLFLDRYAQSVTDNGNTINLNGTGSIGYGVWRLTEADFNQIFNANPVRTR